jgi:uncharacterized protein YegP (UPF0339 family)
MKLQLRKNINGAWFWRLVASNGKILAHSEIYSSRAKAKKTMWRVWEELTSGNCSVEEEEA